MYLMKRKKVFYLFYTDNKGCKRSVSTRQRTKQEALAFMARFSPDRPNEVSEKVREKRSMTYSEFTDFYRAYGSKRFSESYRQFIRHAFSQFGRIVEGHRPLHCVETQGCPAVYLS